MRKLLANWLCAAAIVAAALLAWAPLVHAPFLYDDHQVIERDVGSLWLKPRPLRAISHRIDAHLFGATNATAAHAENLALHGLCAVLWFMLLLRLGRPRKEAVAAALLFAVLPICGESLGIVSHRKEMLALAPMLGALWLLNTPRRLTAASSLVAFLLFALSVMGKETALVLPALASLCIRERRRDESRPLRYWPALALAVAAVALAALSWLQVRASMAAIPGGTEQSEFPRPGHLPAGTTLLQATTFALWAFPHYALRLVSFNGLGIDPSTPLPLQPSILAIAGGAAFFAIWVAAVLWANRKRGDFTLPLAWMAFALAPALFPPLLKNGGLAVLADRYAYAAAPGAALLVSTILRRLLPERGAVFPAAVAVLALAYGTASRATSADYLSEPALWRGVLERNQGSYLAHYNLAFSAWRKENRPQEARTHFQKMLAIRPDFPQGLQAWINFLSQTDGSRAALAWLDAQLSAGTVAHSPLLRKHRGALRSTGGNLRGAEDDFRACLSAGLDDSAVRHNLAVVLQRQLRWKEAAEQFEHSKSDERLPDDAALAAALGGTWPRRGKQAGGPARIIVAGDSVPAGYDAARPKRSFSLAERLNTGLRVQKRNDIAFANRAVPGALLHDLPEKLPALLAPSNITSCVIMAGHNDAFAGTPPSVLMRDMADCILLCRLHGVEPLVLGPIPVRSTSNRDRRRQEAILMKWNRQLAAFCADNGVTFLDTRRCLLESGVTPIGYLDPSTGNHLNEKGLGILAGAVLPLLPDRHAAAGD